jgi:hypothetical protein
MSDATRTNDQPPEGVVQCLAELPAAARGVKLERILRVAQEAFAAPDEETATFYFQALGALVMALTMEAGVAPVGPLGFADDNALRISDVGALVVVQRMRALLENEVPS